MTTVNFYAWDYERQVSETWARSGECNGCGDCCRALIRFRRDTEGQLPERLPLKEGGFNSDGVGIWQGYISADAPQGTRCYKTDAIEPEGVVCPSLLTAENRCGIYAERPVYCQQWPLHPADIAQFPRCSYTFTILCTDAFEDIDKQVV
jgi:Fe-S-cluster containining protein